MRKGKTVDLSAKNCLMRKGKTVDLSAKNNRFVKW